MHDQISSRDHVALDSVRSRVAADCLESGVSACVSQRASLGVSTAGSGDCASQRLHHDDDFASILARREQKLHGSLRRYYDYPVCADACRGSGRDDDACASSQ